MTNRKRLMTIAIMAVSIASIGMFVSQTNSENGVSLFSQNLVDEKTLVDFIEMPNGNFAVQGILGSIEASAVTDTMFLTDEPANWFKSATGGGLPLAAGTPLTVVTPGDAVTFDLDDKSDAKHTVTLLLPVDKLLTVDQSKADDNAIDVTFTDPGIYLFSCKVHPYMQGIVIVTNEDGSIPAVTDADLPYLAKAGISELPATSVASLLTNVAPLNDDPGVILADLKLDKETKWDILENGEDFNGYMVGDTSNFAGGVGEIWVDTQFESVAGQVSSEENKPGSITVLNAADLTIKSEMNGLTSFDGTDQEDTGKWNNPHNMWTNIKHDVVYNGNWFGQWLNLIDRDSGAIIDTITVGKAPTHIVTIPDGPEQGILTLPLSAEDEILKIEDQNGERLKKIDHFQTGSGNNHPHGQWITSDGSMILIPNVFQGAGIAGSIDILDSESGEIIKEFTTDDDGNLLLPVAAAIGNVNGINTGYVSNIGTGTVTVIDMDHIDPVTGEHDPIIINDITVACFTASDGECGTTPDTGIVLETLKLPIQTPVSPDGKYVVTAVFSLVSHLNPDTIAIIDTEADGGKGELIAELACPAGCHGVNWGAKQGGGYYAYVTSQHANVLTVVDPVIADIVAIVPLTNGGDNLTDGTGGQGILPLPLVSNGWIQDTIKECEVNNPDGCSQTVKDWLTELTPDQRFE